MKILQRIFMTVAILFCTVFALNITTFATSATIAFSDPEVNAGDTVDVTVKVSSADTTNLTSAELNLTYDSSAVEFISGTSADGGSGTITISSSDEGATVLTYSLKFKALKEGTTNIEVSSYKVLDAKKSEVSMNKVGFSAITVSGSTETTEEAVNNVESELSKEEEDTQVTEETQEVEETEESTEESNSGSTISISNKYTVTEAPDDLVIPDGYTQTTAVIGDNEEVTWVNANDSNYCLFYLTNEDGEAALYLYDVSEKNVIKYSESVFTSTDSTDSTNIESSYSDLLAKYQNVTTSGKKILYGLIIGCVILVMLIINLLLKLSDKKHRKDEDDYDDEEYDEDDNDENEEEYDEDDNDEEEYDEDNNEEINYDVKEKHVKPNIKHKSSDNINHNLINQNNDLENDKKEKNAHNDEYEDETEDDNYENDYDMDLDKTSRKNIKKSEKIDKKKVKEKKTKEKKSEGVHKNKFELYDDDFEVEFFDFDEDDDN